MEKVVLRPTYSRKVHGCTLHKFSLLSASATSAPSAVNKKISFTNEI